MIVLLTKKFDNEQFEQAQQRGIILEYVPFINTKQHFIDEVAIKWFSEHTFEIWIFTSAVAASYASKLIGTNRVKSPEAIYAVGEKTGATLQNLGIPIVYPAHSNAESLADIIIEKHRRARCCYFKGNISLQTIESKLGSAGMRLTAYECYTTEICKPTINPDRYDSVVFFSPSAVEAYLQSKLAYENKKLFAIGKTTASAVRQLMGQNAVVPEEKGFDALIKCIEANK